MRGRIDTPLGAVPVVDHRLEAADRLGEVRVRLGLGRMHYTVYPGLYALGEPDQDSPVLVTANYKLTFDKLRSRLGGLSAWILALDTNGINVWCAAGKGSFGTENLVTTLQALGLERLVRHRRLILPQLGAVGVAGHEVKRATGFRVIWGPILAADLPRFLRAGRRAQPDMRRVRFPLAQRLVLAPMELIPAMKYGLPLGLALLLLPGLAGGGSFWDQALARGLPTALLALGAIVAGTLVGPALLPWLPGRAFAFKGLWLGLMLGALAGAWAGAGPRLAGAWLLLAGALTSFSLMNFTGSSTFTSLSGVKKEMRLFIPLQVACALAGLGLWAWWVWGP